MDKNSIIFILVIIIIICVFFEKDKKVYHKIIPIGKDNEKFLNFPLVSKIMETESQNNNYLPPTLSNNPNKSRRIYYRNYNINNLPNTQNGNADLVRSFPVMVKSFSVGGKPFLAVSDTTVFEVGDLIVINPNGENIETNFVIGKGNDILRLQTPLLNDHIPNEPIYNKYNQNLNSINIPAQKLGYAKIVSNKYN